MRARRRALSAGERRRLSAAVADRIAATGTFLRSRHIALYLANDGEVDLHGLVQRIWGMGKRCYLPVLSPLFHNRLWFAPFTPEMPLTLNRFGIAEPDLNWHTMRPAWALDLVLTPLVAFDEAGDRLGMGGGFYDRTFAYLNRRGPWRKPRLVGVAFDFQKWQKLPCAVWDVPLDGVVSDVGVYGPVQSA